MTLRKLIRKVHPLLKHSYYEYTILSVAHLSNKKSIVLHQKLGFIETERTHDRIFYECNGHDLVNRSDKYTRHS